MCSITTTVREPFQAHSEKDAIFGLHLDGRKDKTMENVFVKDCDGSTIKK